MPKFITPARITAAIGVLSGLGAAVTALVGALPVGPAATATTIASGLLGSAGVLHKFLDGQSKWERDALYAPAPSHPPLRGRVKAIDPPSPEEPNTAEDLLTAIGNMAAERMLGEPEAEALPDD